MRSVLEYIVLFTLFARDDIVHFFSDRNEGIDESVNFVLWFRFRWFNQPASTRQVSTRIPTDET